MRRPRTSLLASILLPVVLAACNNAARWNKVVSSPTPDKPANLADAPPTLKPAVPTNTSRPCPVTEPNGSTPPGELPHVLHHGNGDLWTALWPEGRVVFEPKGSGFIRPDGSLLMKWPWWRGAKGKLTIEGRRLDASAPPLRSAIPDGYGETGFQASALNFPTEGCWEVTGKVGEASLTFVSAVLKVAGRK